MNHWHYSCYNILSFTQHWMPGHCHYFRCECFHVPRDRMMTFLLTIMIMFGAQAMWKLAKRLSGWQSGSHCQSAAVTERGQMPRRLMPRWMPLCAWQLPALPNCWGSARREKSWEMWSWRWAAISQIQKLWVMGGWGWTHACQCEICQKCTNTGTADRPSKNLAAYGAVCLSRYMRGHHT